MAQIKQQSDSSSNDRPCIELPNNMPEQLTTETAVSAAISSSTKTCDYKTISRRVRMETAKRNCNVVRRSITAAKLTREDMSSQMEFMENISDGLTSGHARGASCASTISLTSLNSISHNDSDNEQEDPCETASTRIEPATATTVNPLQPMQSAENTDAEADRTATTATVAPLTDEETIANRPGTTSGHGRAGSSVSSIYSELTYFCDESASVVSINSISEYEQEDARKTEAETASERRNAEYDAEHEEEEKAVKPHDYASLRFTSLGPLMVVMEANDFEVSDDDQTHADINDTADGRSIESNKTENGSAPSYTADAQSERIGDAEQEQTSTKHAVV